MVGIFAGYRTNATC